MKSLDDIKQDMSLLYDRLNANEIEIKQAAELANICGKFLKAEQLALAREIFIANSSSVLINRTRSNTDDIKNMRLAAAQGAREALNIIAPFDEQH